jgi:hypothetical protein
MRAREFVTEANGTRNITLNIPITVTIPADGSDPQVDTPGDEETENGPLINTVMVSPLQQELELSKQQGGKKSAVIDQVLKNDGALSDEEPEYEVGTHQSPLRK